MRFARCELRRRSDAVGTLEQFLRRDMRELALGLAELIAYGVDEVVVNQ